MGWHNRLLVSEQTQPLLFLTKIEYRSIILYQNQYIIVLNDIKRTLLLTTMIEMKKMLPII